MIPKRLIQLWDGAGDPSPIAKAAAINFKCLNPDFECLRFDGAGMASFVSEHFPEYRGVFEGFPLPVQRYDFFRYLSVYRLGGFYLDLDVILTTSLTGLLQHQCVFAFEELTQSVYLRSTYGMDWEVGNYAFGAVAGHPFLGAVIENCVRAQRQPDWIEPMMRPIPRIFRGEYYVLNTTGPGLVSRTLAEYSGDKVPVTVLFPDNVCDCRNWDRFGDYGVHLKEGRWRSPKSIWRARLLNAWRSRIKRVLLKESMKLGTTRYA